MINVTLLLVYLVLGWLIGFIFGVGCLMMAIVRLKFEDVDDFRDWLGL